MTDAVVATLDGEPLRAAFPMRVELFGVSCVVVPADVYEELRAEAARKEGQASFKRKPRSPIDNDREVAEFLAGSRSTLFLP